MISSLICTWTTVQRPVWIWVAQWHIHTTAHTHSFSLGISSDLACATLSNFLSLLRVMWARGVRPSRPREEVESQRETIDCPQSHPLLQKAAWCACRQSYGGSLCAERTTPSWQMKRQTSCCEATWWWASVMDVWGYMKNCIQTTNNHSNYPIRAA